MAEHEAEMTLRDYGRVVVRRKWVVVIATLISALAAVVLTAMQTPVYSASAEVLIQPRGEDALFETDVQSLSQRSILTEIQVIEGVAVRDRVQSNLGLDEPPPRVDASAVGETDVIRLSVVDANATNAAIYADAYAIAYIEVRREQSVNGLLAASVEVQAAIDQLESEIEALPEADPLRSTLLAQQANFNTTLDQLRVDAALRTGGAFVIRTAEVPDSPIEPTVLRTTVLAAVVGLLIGLGAAFLIDYLDDKIRTADDLEELTDHPILVEVPTDPPPDNRPISMSEPSHPAVESYRGLRTNLQFIALDRSLRTLQVTSSLPAEGKTTTATNLAVVLARSGHSVALLDADLRRPTVHHAFGLKQSPGMSELLIGGLPKEIVHAIDVGDDHRIWVYTAGTVPSNPSEMLSSRRLKSLVTEMGAHYDYVIIDSAPVLPVSDAAALASAVDGVLVVAHADRVTNANISKTLERLEQVSAPIIGLIVNQTVRRRNSTYYYDSYSSHDDEEPPELEPDDPPAVTADA